MGLFDKLMPKKAGCARWCVSHFPSLYGTPSYFMEWSEAMSEAIRRRGMLCEVRVSDKASTLTFANQNWRAMKEPTPDEIAAILAHREEEIKPWREIWAAEAERSKREWERREAEYQQANEALSILGAI